MEEVLRGALQLAGPGEEKTKARALVNLSVNIQAGVSIMGSKNVVVLNGKRDVSKDSAKDDEPLAAERKRRAESVSGCHAHECFSKQTLMERIGARRHAKEGG